MRVYELARELDMHSFELMRQLHDLGIAVRSPLSGLQDSQVAHVRTRAGDWTGSAHYGSFKGGRYAAEQSAVKQERGFKHEYTHRPGENSLPVMHVAQSADRMYEQQAPGRDRGVTVLQIAFKMMLWCAVIVVLLVLLELFLKAMYLMMVMSAFVAVDKLLSSKPRGRRR